MIVRDEERNLPTCLESVRGIFDEIVVVDTGSQDRTKEIATGFGARVFDFTWIDDFAAARNAALEHATGDYAFWLDADDVLDAPQSERLRLLLDSLDSNRKKAYVLRCFCDTEDGTILAVDHPRLFPLRTDVRFVGRIHEQIIPALTQSQIEVVWTDVVIRHTGYADPVLHERKRQRNFAMLTRELGERPEDAFIYYYLGTLAFERKKWLEALGFFTISLAKWGTRESIACKLFAMIAWTNEILHRREESLRTCEEGLFYFPDDHELLFRKAVACRYLLRTSEAEICWKRILALPRPQKLYNVDQGIYGHLTRRNLAIIAAERNDKQEARIYWQAVLAECPGDNDALSNIQKMAT